MRSRPSPLPMKDLRVLHLLRAPAGGLFRHVCDLAAGQEEAGLKVGVICAEEPGDPVSARRFEALRRCCRLGVHAVPMNRMPGLGDMLALARISTHARALSPDVVHGHGAKGGAYARLLPKARGGVRIYTPHGGALHFDPRSVQGAAFLAAERFMRRRTGGFIFESDFGLRSFIEKAGEPGKPSIVVHNGVGESEFDPVRPYADAADFVFIGELRMLKGVATLIEAASSLGTPVRLRIVGAGPDRARFEDMARNAPSATKIEFMGAMPAREAFALGRAVVMPSHHESLPYVALEAAAAGMPLIATRVGGIPEIFGPDAARLVEPDNVPALAAALAHALREPDDLAGAAMRLRRRVMNEFSLRNMVESVIGFYDELLNRQAAMRAAALPGGAVRLREGVRS